MKKIRANVCAVTHAGRVRGDNEDNYDLNGKTTASGDLRKGSAFVQSMAEPFHLAVCDGMSGESYGELASGIAVEAVAAHAGRVYESGEDFSFAISNCLGDANDRICAEINARGKRMGTTLAAIYAVKGKIICVNIGDTRIYRYSKGILEQVSFDHTHAQTIVDAGGVSQDNISRIPEAKRLTRYLGVLPEEADLVPNISVIDDADDGDIMLLCSDGLTDMVGDESVNDILSMAENAQDAASKLVRAALENGGKDNVTVITAFIEVEETAIFAPIAAKLAGDSDADYEDEYRESYGSNQIPAEGENVSPYANANARAYVAKPDGSRILKIVGGAVGAAALVLIIALIVKACVKGNREETTTLAPGTTYGYYYERTTFPAYYRSTERVFTVWTEESTSETETDATASTTRKKPSTARSKPSTAKRKPSTAKRKPSTTRRKPSTTRRKPSAAPVSTTAPKPVSTLSPTAPVATTVAPTLSPTAPVATTAAPTLSPTEPVATTAAPTRPSETDAPDRLNIVKKIWSVLESGLYIETSKPQ